MLLADGLEARVPALRRDSRGRLHFAEDPLASAEAGGALTAAERPGGEAVALGLRFFAPGEVARLHGLPEDFAARAAEAGLSAKQQWQLLGNSLVASPTVSTILDLLLDP